MRFFRILKSFGALFILLITLTACPPKEYVREDLLKLLDNKMDFPEFQRVYFDEISFLMPKMFDKNNYASFTLKTDQCVYLNNDLNLFFTCEHFYSDEAESLQYLRDDNPSFLDAIHDMYVAKRIAVLKNNKLSIKKETYSKSDFPGLSQTISGGNGYGEANTYLINTLEINGEYYVFQLIGRIENMDYLENDFEKIITSVKL